MTLHRTHILPIHHTVCLKAGLVLSASSPTYCNHTELSFHFLTLWETKYVPEPAMYIIHVCLMAICISRSWVTCVVVKPYFDRPLTGTSLKLAWWKTEKRFQPILCIVLLQFLKKGLKLKSGENDIKMFCFFQNGGLLAQSRLLYKNILNFVIEC